MSTLPSTARDAVLTYAAPALLLLVACMQLFLATTASLSPWKGGGFGMFSTVDAPSARFLRVYLVGEAEDVPVLLPGSLERRVREVRTVPRAHLLRGLAEAVAEGAWTRYQLSPAVRRYRALLGEGVPDDALAAVPGVGDGVARSVPVAVSFDEIRLLRMADEQESIPPEDVVPFREVRAELWQYRFDDSSMTLTADRMLEVTVAKAEPR